MKRAVLGGVLFLATFSCGLSAQQETGTEAKCQIIPTTPFSRSIHARYSGTGQRSLQMGSRSVLSQNWGGYAAFTSPTLPQFGSVSGVRGEWRVPSVRPSTQDSYSATWVGIDGYSNDTVEQIGTMQGWFGGQANYYAWFSMYPGPSYELAGFPVHPKDYIRAEVNYVGGDVYELVIRNLTQNVYYVIPSSYTTVPGTQRASAEWIVEAPSDTTILPLAHFSPTPFFHCVATINKKSGRIDSHRWKNRRIIMVTEGKTVKAKPSTLSGSGKHFTVKWHHQ